MHEKLDEQKKEGPRCNLRAAAANFEVDVIFARREKEK